MSLPPGPIPELAAVPLVIDTPRLRLRPVTEADAPAIFELARDPEVPRLMSWDAHPDVEHTRAFLRASVDEHARGGSIVWAIEHGGEVAGCIGLHGITWTFRAWRIDRAELGYWLGKRFWGKGVMSEAAFAATDFAFATLGLHKITIGCIAGNAASQRIIEKLGYRYLATHVDDVWRDGRWWDHLRYEMLRREWRR